MSEAWHIGVLGGSGLYEGIELENQQQIEVSSPFGEPSGPVTTGTVGHVRLTFMARHGAGHAKSPDTVNYRANIDVMKRCGVTDLIAISAIGSLREEMAPTHFVGVDQFIDRTFAREKSFFGTGCVAHVSVAHPTCPRLGTACATAARDAGITVHEGGTYLAMEGPQFSTLAESKMYRESWGADVIGMTNMPEAKLAREAELCYASIAMVTDYDSWHPDHGEVDIMDIIKTLTGNADKGREMVRRLPALLGAERAPCPHGCDRALEYAMLTAPEKRDPALLAKLDAVAGRMLGGN